MPAPATLDEFKAHLNKDVAATAEDDELTMTLEAATEAVEGWHGIGPLAVRTVTERVSVARGRAFLTSTPVRSVTSLTSVADGAVYVTADLDLDGSSGIVRGSSAYLPAGDYTAVYEAGRDPVPSSLILATLIIGKHLWETQRGPKRPMRGEDVDITAQWAGAGYLIPNRAAHLMQPYASVMVG